MSIRLIGGDCREVLATLPANSVHCVVTSPPYYGLRDYGTAQWAGGDAACDHLMPPNGVRDKGRDRAASGGTFHDSPIPNQIPMQFRDTCGKCGATRVDRQIGLEATPSEYLTEMVRVFREVRRVLRPDGTCWVNMGDSYSGSTTNTNSGFNERWGNAPGDHKQESGRPVGSRPGKPKDLLLMPARLALALQADGWWLRSDIIWHKPNPMPESVTDRPTSAHEHVFLLTRSARYYYDADAVRETAQDWTNGGPGIGIQETQHYGAGNGGNAGLKGIAQRYKDGTAPTSRNLRNVWTIPTTPFSGWVETSRPVPVAWDAFVDGKMRRASPDCPVHADRPAQAPNAGDDAHAVGSLSHIARSDADLVQAPAGDYVPSVPPHRLTSEGQSSGSLPLWHSPAATSHSSQTHRTAHEPSTTLPCSVSDRTGDGIAHTSAEPSPPDWVGHMPESNISQAGLADPPLAGTGSHSVDNASSVDLSRCTCEWYIEKTEKSSHFATFPPALAERCIRAGTSERGCCAACRAPWGRIVESSGVDRERNFRIATDKAMAGVNEAHRLNGKDYVHARIATTGWSPSCACGTTETRPAVVLDPFAGAGTTLLVADRLQRDAIGIELSPDYTRMAMDRCRDDAPLFAEPSPPPAEAPEEPRIRDLFA